MDRQETISREEAVRTISRISGGSVSYAEDLYDSFFEKPVVPQYVADWYEENKKDFDYNLWDYLTSWDQQKGSDFKGWINNETDTFQTLVNMHQFGYEVEEETKYRISVKAINDEDKFLKREKDENVWYFGDSSAIGILQHTRKELEDADFGWVFSCPGVEVKEVGE